MYSRASTKKRDTRKSSSETPELRDGGEDGGDVDKEGFVAYETIYDEQNVKRWEVAVLRSPTGDFNQISFVNSVYTPGGGTHVTYILDKVVKAFQGIIEKNNPQVFFIPCDPFSNCEFSSENFFSGFFW
jgi:hypothetical protein